MSAHDRLRAEKLRGGVIIGSEVVVLEQTESTNDVIRQMIDRPEGLCVFAEEQIAGRGQRGNKWESVRGKGLWFSILLRPKIDIKDSARLTTWVTDVIAQTIADEFDLPAVVKPPNDVYIGERKIAGVLVEMRAQPGGPHIAIVGIGVNVNHAPSDFSEEVRDLATSLAILRRESLDRNRFALALLRNLDRTYAELIG
jgi:BirA family biotin operon repressor/biotin-[acetyl-CoA-carboxylase] ligase